MHSIHFNFYFKRDTGGRSIQYYVFYFKKIYSGVNNKKDQWDASVRGGGRKKLTWSNVQRKKGGNMNECSLSKKNKTRTARVSSQAHIITVPSKGTERSMSASESNMFLSLSLTIYSKKKLRKVDAGQFKVIRQIDPHHCSQLSQKDHFASW